MNGEIYNFRELRLELQAKGYHFKMGSDSEVLLHLYHAEGDDYAHQYQRLPAWIRSSAASSARQLPADRHSDFLNTLRLAKGFLASADMPCDDRYRSYLQVMDREAVAALLMRSDGAQPDALARAFAVAGHEDTLNPLLAVDAEPQSPDDVVMQKVLATGKRKIGFIGLSFKTGTDDLRESPLVTLAEQLIGKGMLLSIYNPQVHLAQLIGSNRSFVEKHLPHIGQMLRPDIKDVVNASDLLLVGRGGQVVYDALTKYSRADQLVLDLVNLPNRTAISSPVEGLCC